MRHRQVLIAAVHAPCERCRGASGCRAGGRGDQAATKLACSAREDLRMADEEDPDLETIGQAEFADDAADVLLDGCLTDLE
jgi:hypothetical protein